MDKTSKDLISVAIVRKPQGIKGEVKISALLDDPNDIKKFKTLYSENGMALNIKRVYQLGQDFGIGFNEITSPEEALKLKNQNLYAKRNDVFSLAKHDEFFIEDLLGKTAIFEDGEVVGKISAIENYGASDIVFIASKFKKNLCFANIGGIILKIDGQNAVFSKSAFNEVALSDEEGERDED